VRSPGRVFWPLASLLVLADCSTKRAIEEAAPLVGVPHPVIDNVVQFTLGYNQGAAFSTHLGTYQRPVLIGLALLILVILARSYRVITRTGRVGTAGLALVVGGAVGNLLDRLMSDRGVVDFIDVGFGSSRFYVFNVADVGVSIGAALLAYAIWRSDRRDPAATSLP
jgi:signal peptidase II